MTINFIEERCWNCKYFRYPDCRRHAPIGNDDLGYEIFPRPRDGYYGWCGDFEAIDEDKKESVQE